MRWPFQFSSIQVQAFFPKNPGYDDRRNPARSAPLRPVRKNLPKKCLPPLAPIAICAIWTSRAIYCSRRPALPRSRSPEQK
jgi:hypothetical protein